MLSEDALGPTFAEFFRKSDFGATKDILETLGRASIVPQLKVDKFGFIDYRFGESCSLPSAGFAFACGLILINCGMREVIFVSSCLK